MNKKPALWKHLLILGVILILLIPAIRLIHLYISLMPKSHVLEVNSYDKMVTRYTYDRKATGDHISGIDANKNKFDQTEMKSYSLDEYYNSIYNEYKIEDQLEEIADFYNKTLKIAENRERNELIKSIDTSLTRVTLGKKESEIIGDMAKLKILHNFDGSLAPNKVDENENKEIIDKLDNSKGAIEATVNEKFLKTGKRDPELFRLYTKNQFYTSPVPDNTKQNLDSELDALSIELSKDKYYSFEIIEFNVIAKARINIDDLKIFVMRDDYIFPNVGGRSDAFLKYNKHTIYGTMAMGYNPSPGKYTLMIKSKSNPIWKGISADFHMIKRQVPPLQKGFSVVNWEHSTHLKTFNIMGPDRTMGKYEKIVEWVKFMDADAFWMLGAQTTGWHEEINENQAWAAGGAKNLSLLGPIFHSNNIQVGAYIMSFFTPANGKKMAGYEPSLGYNLNDDKLEDSYHISLSCPKRFNDLLAKLKEFEANPYVDYVGLDFIRTGHVDGYEHGPQVINEMNIEVPPEYEKMTRIDKVKYFARRVKENDQNVVIKWRWWRAHRVAEIVNKLIVEGGITKPLWVFTLGWEHGKQHGQDPYMMFDAGAFIDAVMLYEANVAQFRNMMYQWPNYMRDNRNNLMIGNSADYRLVDGPTDDPALEYIYRTTRGYREVYREGNAKGIFIHDLSRALWSSKRGITTLEWAAVHGHATSLFRYEAGILPYQVFIKFNKDLETGTITVKNNWKQKLSGLKLKFVPTESWEEVSDNIPKEFSLNGNSAATFTFKARVLPERRKEANLLSYELSHPHYRKYFGFTKRTSQDFESYINYVKPISSSKKLRP